MHEADDAYSGAPGHVMAGPIFHTIQHMDFVETATFHWICLLFILFILVGIRHSENKYVT